MLWSNDSEKDRIEENSCKWQSWHIWEEHVYCDAQNWYLEYTLWVLKGLVRLKEYMQLGGRSGGDSERVERDEFMLDLIEIHCDTCI